MAGERILVVDDEADILDIYMKLLKQAGFVVQGASTGLEAIEHCRQGSFDLLIIDLKLPDISGLEVLRQGKQLLPDMAAIIVTAFGTLETTVEAMRLGAQEFVLKPFDGEVLLAKIQQVLAHRQASAAVVKGNLRTMSLASLISINCNEGNQARLTIRYKGQRAEIFFDNGNIVHMGLDGREGEEVIYDVLAWEEGIFELVQGVPPPKHTVTTSWPALLLKGLQRLDESTMRTVGREEAEGVAQKEARDKAQTLASKLRKLEGVEGAVIAACDGVVLAYDVEGDAEKEAAVAVFVGNAAAQAGNALALGGFERGVVTMGKDRMLVLGRSDYYVGLLLEERSSPALVTSQAESILQPEEVA